MPLKEKIDPSKIDDRYSQGRGSYERSQEDYDKEFDNIIGNNYPDGDPGGESSKLGWVNNVDGAKSSGGVSGGKPSVATKVLGAIKRNKGKAFFGVGGVGGLLAVFFLFLTPASLFVALTDNLSIHGDTSSHSMERRFSRVLQRLVAGSAAGDGIACKAAKCRGGSLSNKGLNSLHKKGVVINFEGGGTYDGKTKKGMPGKKISSYTIDGQDIKPNKLKGHLAKNPKAASKFLGTRGAFNLRVKSMAGKYVGTKFFSKFNISKGASLAKALSKPFKKGANRAKDIRGEIKKRIPGMEKMSNAMNGVGDRWGAKIKKAGGKGGAAYAVALGACIVSKAPTIIGGAAAGVELLRLLPLINDVMSAGSYSKAAPMWQADDPSIEFTQESADAMGAYLTETDSNGKSALDSKYLMAAIGVNTNKLPVSKKFAPGYDAVTNTLMETAKEFESLLAGPCSYLMGPIGMSIGVALGLAAGPFSFAASMAISFAVTPVVSWVVGKVGSWATGNVLDMLLDNDKLENIKGEELGDALGVGAMAYFSSQSMSRSVQPLSVEGVKQFAAIKNENTAEERARDIASHSPFDTSSRHTFLGSIANTSKLAMIQNGGLSNNIFARLGAFIKMPVSFAGMAVAGTGAYASTLVDVQNCSYAGVLGLEGENDSETPAVNAALMPCTGITTEQANMSSQMAIDALASRGWIDMEQEVSEEATVEEFLEKVVKKDTPLAFALESCSDPATGDYLAEMGGCMTISAGKTLGGVEAGEDVKNSDNAHVEVEDGKYGNELLYGSGGENDEDYVAPSSVVEVNPNNDQTFTDAQAINAMSVFLIDLQLERMMNGYDDEEGGGMSAPAGIDMDLDKIFEDSTNIPCGAGTTEVRNDDGYNKGVKVPIKVCSIDIAQAGTEVNSRSSAASAALMKKMKEDLKIEGEVKINSSFRTMATQQSLYASMGSPQAAPPGFSNHQMGLALDFNMGDAYGWSTCGYTAGTGSCPGSKVWVWLKENASSFGFKQYSAEYWHWSPVEDTEYK